MGQFLQGGKNPCFVSLFFTESLRVKFQQILTELPTAATRVLDEQWRVQKKGKSSEFDAEDDDHIKSGLAVEV